jgi:hypothetical protein
LANRLSRTEQEAGWRLLFDGESTAGWRGMLATPFPSDHWEVKEGALRAVPSLLGRDLVTTEEFENFEFSFDFKLSRGGNSGVKYLVDEFQENAYEKHVRAGMWATFAGLLAALLFARLFLWRQHRILLRFDGRVWTAAVLVLMALAGWAFHHVFRALEQHATGLEMQLVDDERHSDGRYPDRRAGSLYDLIPAAESRLRPPGRWNTGRIVVQGRRVQHWINRVKVVEYLLESPELLESVADSKFRGLHGFGRKRGRRLVLQHHQDEVWFRNLKVRPLDPPVGPEAPPPLVDAFYSGLRHHVGEQALRNRELLRRLPAIRVPEARTKHEP